MSVIHFESGMCGRIFPGDEVTTDLAAVTCQDCRDRIGPTDAEPLPSPTPPPRKASIEELEKLLAREPDIPLEILPNGEIREYSEEEKASIRSERKPLTMRENLGGEYADSSFAVPAEMADHYTHEPAPAFKLEDPASPHRLQNMVDPSAPPPRSATLEEIVEATKHLPRRPRTPLLGSYGYASPLAIAASLAAEFPGMFDGDVLLPMPSRPLEGVLMPSPDVARRFEQPRIDEAPCLVVDSIPQLKPTPSRVPKMRPLFGRGCKPAGSKLARKAARGKL